MSLPLLEAGAGLMLAMFAGPLVVALWIALPGLQTGIWNVLETAAMVLVWTVIFWVLGLIVIGPIHRAFPEKIRTAGDLARIMARRNQGKMAAEAGGTTAQQAWRSFQELVGERAGVRPGLVRREMLFPEDLGIY